MQQNELNFNDIAFQFELLGLNPSYENFILFVKRELAPYMQSKFLEEKYYKKIYEDCWKNRHNLMQLPRGHSKTELIGIWLTIFIAVCKPYNKFFNKYDKRIEDQTLIAADGDAMNAWAYRIKHFFYENPRLNLYVPLNAAKDKKNDYWNSKEIFLKNNSIIHFRYIGGKIRGIHTDRLHADDLVTENSQIVDQTIKDKWDGAVDGITTNKLAMVQVTGTPLRLSDILFHLKDRGYYFTKLPAIIDFNKKIILSPTRWSFEDLMKTKERIGSTRFSCEYMLNPIDDGKSLIRRDWILDCYSKSFNLINTEKELKTIDLNKKLRPSWAKAVYLGVDFAFSDRITADKSVFTIIAEYRKDEKSYFVLLDQIIKKGMSGPEQLDFIKDTLNPLYNFDLIGVEENSLTAIRPNIRELHLPIRRFWTGNRDEKQETKKPDKQYTTVSKRNLILRIGTMFENKELIIPYKDDYSKNNAEILTNECITYAQEKGNLVEVGIHGDCPIALGYALEVAKGWNTGFLI